MIGSNMELDFVISVCFMLKLENLVIQTIVLMLFVKDNSFLM